MNNNYSKLKESILTGFQNNKGRCTARINKSINVIPILIDILIKFNNKHPYGDIFIAVDTYNTRKQIIDAINENNLKFKYTILGVDYINPKYSYKYSLIITIGINSQLEILKKFIENSKFILCIITENILDNVFNSTLSKLLPNISINISIEEIKTENVYSPVEEYRISMELSDEDREQYLKYSEYITTSIIIFGTFQNIEKCKSGDKYLNISATEIRNNIAQSNGWHDKLDTSIEFNKQIDDIYNPNALLERANNIYSITKLRRDLVTDNIKKLDIIKDIILKNANKKIIILSKRGQFAAEITKYLKDNDILCGDYHDCVEDTIATDDNGIAILVKSGEKKGNPKIISHRAISSNNLNKYNNNTISILSIKQASNSALDCDVDILIITSTLCEDIYDIKKRFQNMIFSSIPNIVYSIYCKSTIEQISISEVSNSPLHTIIENEINDFEYNPESGEIFL